jgi:hypothetical protein
VGRTLLSAALHFAFALTFALDWLFASLLQWSRLRSLPPEQSQKQRIRVSAQQHPPSVFFLPLRSHPLWSIIKTEVWLATRIDPVL